MSKECMIWTPEGVTLETEGEWGTARLSGVGQWSLRDTEEFCKRVGLDLVVKIPNATHRVSYDRGGSAQAKRGAAMAALAGAR